LHGGERLSKRLTGHGRKEGRTSCPEQVKEKAGEKETSEKACRKNGGKEKKASVFIQGEGKRLSTTSTFNQGKRSPEGVALKPAMKRSRHYWGY